MNKCDNCGSENVTYVKPGYAGPNAKNPGRPYDGFSKCKDCGHSVKDEGTAPPPKQKSLNEMNNTSGGGMGDSNLAEALEHLSNAVEQLAEIIARKS